MSKNERFSKIEKFFNERKIKWYFRQSKLCQHTINFHLGELYYINEYSFTINGEKYILIVKIDGRPHYLIHEHDKPIYPAICGGWKQQMVIDGIRKYILNENIDTIV